MIESVDRHTSAFAGAAIDNCSSLMTRNLPVTTWDLAVADMTTADAVVAAGTAGIAGNKKGMTVVVVVAAAMVAAAVAFAVAWGTAGIAAEIPFLHIAVAGVVDRTGAVVEIVQARRLLTLASPSMMSNLVTVDQAAGRIATGVGH